jgi:predicted RNA-binding protein with PIN domain
VVYSKRGERADQVIQRLAMEFGPDCAVVSSDREVADFSKAHGAFVIGAAEFESKLHAAPAIAPRTGYALKDKDAEDGSLSKRNPEKKGNARKLPKTLRKRHRRLKGF